MQDDYHGDILCVYPLSGFYGLLPRILYYVTLVFAISARSKEWLVIGALVSALTYAGTAAIHAMTLISSKAPIFDLDLYGVWAILSTAALAYVTLIHWSDTLRNSRARLIMHVWAFLVGLSLIFGQSALFNTPLSTPEPACRCANGQLLKYPYQLMYQTCNCTYKCFATQKPMRSQSEIMAVPVHMLENQYSRLGVVLVGPIMFAAYAVMSFDTSFHTPSQVCTRLVMIYLKPKPRDDMVRAIYNASSEAWYGGYWLLYAWVHRTKWSWAKVQIAILALPWLTLALVIDILCIPMLITNVILNELTILASHLPTNESPYAVGQWGAVVSSALVVIAALISKGLDIREERKKEKDIPRDETGLVDSSEINVPDLEEQTIGIDTPKLSYQRTLQDMEDILKASKR